MRNTTTREPPRCAVAHAAVRCEWTPVVHSAHPFSLCCSLPPDLDQIQEDLAKHAANPTAPRKFDQELPGCGQYYCLVCARYFTTDKVLEEHVKSKVHKKRSGGTNDSGAREMKHAPPCAWARRWARNLRRARQSE